MLKTNDLDLAADYIDVRDIIARVEDLRSELETEHEATGTALMFDAWRNESAEDDTHTLQDACAELPQLEAILIDLKGNGGDEQWKGDWYPVGLIKDSAFEDHAREMAADIGAIGREPGWPQEHINWESAAEALQGDYSSVEIGGETYWYR